MFTDEGAGHGFKSKGTTLTAHGAVISKGPSTGLESDGNAGPEKFS